MWNSSGKSLSRLTSAQVVIDEESQVIIASSVTQEANDKAQLVPMLKLAHSDLYVSPDRCKHGQEPPLAMVPPPLEASVAARMRYKLRTHEGREVYKRRKTIEAVFGQIKEARGFRRFSLRGLDRVAAEWTWSAWPTASPSCSVAVGLRRLARPSPISIPLNRIAGLGNPEHRVMRPKSARLGVCATVRQPRCPKRRVPPASKAAFARRTFRGSCGEGVRRVRRRGGGFAYTPLGRGVGSANTATLHPWPAATSYWVPCNSFTSLYGPLHRALRPHASE
jgi:hypothetical protein